MAFTTESIDVAPAPSNNLVQNQFDLPVKEFLAYDPKGTTTVTGTQIVRKDASQPAITEEPVAPAESVALSPQVSALARAQAEVRKQKQALAAREQAMADKIAKAERFEKLEAAIKAKDFSAAEELGLTYDEYTNYSVKKLEGEKPEEARFRKLEEENAAVKKALEERTRQEYQANQKLWKSEITKVVKGNEAYPEINFAGAEAEAAILQHINDSFEEDDIELTAEQAAKDIEKFLADRALKFSESPTVKNKFSEAKVLGPPKAGLKTITQDVTVTSQKPATKPFHLMSESEQIAEAIRRVQAAKQMR